MKSKLWWLMGAGILTLSLLTLYIFTFPSHSACEPRQDDPEGYLFRICTYIQEKQINVSPADPTRYRIKRIEEREENGRPVVWVFLNCCYLGDIAIIDKASGEVIQFRVGDQ